MIEFINRYLNELTRHSTRGSQKRHSHNAKIARYDLVYDNKEMLTLLINRGFAIKTKNKEEILKIESEILDFKEKQYYTDIVGCFITYQTWEDVKCISFASSKEVQLFGSRTKVRHAD